MRMQLFGAAAVAAIAAALLVDSAAAISLDAELTPGQREELANVLEMAQSLRIDATGGHQQMARPKNLAQNGGHNSIITQPMLQSMSSTHAKTETKSQAP